MASLRMTSLWKYQPSLLTSARKQNAALWSKVLPILCRALLTSTDSFSRQIIWSWVHMPGPLQSVQLSLPFSGSITYSQRRWGSDAHFRPNIRPKLRRKGDERRSIDDTALDRWYIVMRKYKAGQILPAQQEMARRDWGCAWLVRQCLWLQLGEFGSTYVVKWGWLWLIVFMLDFLN